MKRMKVIMNSKGVPLYAGYLKPFKSRQSATKYLQRSHLSRKFYYKIVKEKPGKYVVYLSHVGK